MTTIEKPSSLTQTNREIERNILNRKKTQSPPINSVNPLIKEVEKIKEELKKYESYPDTHQKNPQNISQYTFHDAPSNIESHLRQAFETSHRNIEFHNTAIDPQLVQLQLGKGSVKETKELFEAQ